jgi:hypothetical protein
MNGPCLDAGRFEACRVDTGRLDAEPLPHTTSDHCRADSIHKAGACVAASFVDPGLSVAAARLLDMDLQAPPGDAVGRAVGGGAPDAPPCAPAPPPAAPSPASPSPVAGDPESAWGLVGAASDAVAVAGAGLWRCTDEQLVDLLRAQAADLARIEAARLGLVRELDARGWAARVGATSTQAWLAHALRVDPRAAAADVRAARALDPAGDAPPEPGAPTMTGAPTSADGPVLAATGRALAGGALSRAHADAVLASVRALPTLPAVPADTGAAAGADGSDGERAETREQLVARAEAWLLDKCGQFDPATVRRLGREVAHALDPSDVLAGELAAAARDELWLTPTDTGRVRVRGELDQVTGALLVTLVDAGAGPRPSAEDGPDRRPPATRRAHAFGEVLRLAANAEPKIAGGLRPQLIVTIPHDSLRDALLQATQSADDSDRAAGWGARRLAVTETGTTISAGWARKLACDATIIPTVLGSASEPLDIGRASRVIPPGLRRALITRDHGCAFPGCRRPPRWTDAHHIRHWADGGPTALNNLVLLCDHHHDVIHHTDWAVTIEAGRPVFTPPAWLDPLRRARPPTDPTAA